MKKLISTVLASALSVSMVMMAAAAPEPTDAPQKASYTATETTVAITIDGKMDDAYKNAEVVKLDKKQMIDLLADEADIATGEMRILWDSTAIYVYAVVNDSTYAPPYKDPSWFNNVDSFWVAVGANEDLSKTHSYDIPRAGTVLRKMAEDSPDAEFVVKNMKDGQEVAMGTYGNAEGNYPANSPKPNGPVDSYVVEIKIPYTGAKVGGTAYFGAFICDDVNFANADASTVNLVDGRARTSEAVSTDNDNGIWQVTGTGDGQVPDAKMFFDDLTFRAVPSEDDPAPNPNPNPSTGSPLGVAAVTFGVVSAVVLVASLKKKSR